MLDNRNSHPPPHPPKLPHEPRSGPSPSPNSPCGSQGTYADRAVRNTKWQLVHKVIFDAKGDSIYATHNPLVTNPFPGTVKYTGFPRDTNATGFHIVCWDTVAPILGYQTQREKNGTKSIFVGFNLMATQYKTRAEMDQHIMATPVTFGGKQYLPQIPIPANVDITKVYVSRLALPEEKIDPDEFISNGLRSFFSSFARVLKITLPTRVTGHYVMHHLDAHVFLAPLKDGQAITFPELTKDDLYEVPAWGHKIHTVWAKDAPCT